MNDTFDIHEKNKQSLSPITIRNIFADDTSDINTQSLKVIVFFFLINIVLLLTSIVPAYLWSR